MRLFRTITLILFISTLVFSQTTDIFTKKEISYIKSNPHIKVGMLNNFKPFSYVENNQHKGMSKDILEKISHISGLNFDIKTNRWSTTLKNFKDKKTDIILDISHKIKREEFALFSEPYFEIPTFIFGLKTDKLYKNNNSLIGKTVAVSKDIFYKDSLKKLGIKVKEYDSSIEKAKAVITGKADYFLSSFTTGQKAITNQALITLKPIDEFSSIKKEDLRFGIKKESIILHSIIEKSLKQISSLELATLANKWIINIEKEKKSSLNFTKQEQEYIKNNPSIKVHNELKFAPFNYFYNGKPSGFSIRYMDLVASKVGLNIEYVSGPSWNQFLYAMKNNTLDVMLNIAVTEDRKSYLNFTSPYIESIDAIFGLKNNDPRDKIRSLDDLKGKKVSVVKGFYEEELIEKYYPQIELVKANDSIEAFKQVLFGNADATVNNYSVGMYIIEKYAMQKLEPKFEIKDKRFNLNLAIATSKKNTLLNSILQKGMNSISQEEYKKLQKDMLYKIESKAIEQELLTKKEKDYLSKRKSIKMCNDPDFAPFEFKVDYINNNKKDQLSGVSIDIVKKLEKKLNIKFEHIPTNTKNESNQYLKDKVCDILPSDIRTTEKLNYANFTVPYLQLDMAIITKKDKPFISNINAILDKKISINSTSTMIELLEQKYKNIDLIKTNDKKDSFFAVQKNDSYATISSLIEATYYKKRYHLDDLQIAGYSNLVYEISMAVREDDKVLLSILNKALRSITYEDKQKIISKWSDVKIEQKTDYSIFYKIITIILFILLVIIYWNRKLQKEKTRVQQAIKAKHESLEALGLALDVANLGTFEWDMIKDTMKWNEINHKIFGTNPNEFKPTIKDFILFIPTSDREKFQEAINKAVLTKKAIQIEQYIKRENGNLRFINLKIKVIAYTKDNEPKKLLGTVNDITTQKHLENSLREAKNKAELATKSKSYFLANMSHEIRTPMNAIIGMSHLLEQTELNSKQKDFVKKLDTASNTLLNIINDILDFSKIEAGKLNIENINFKLSDLVENVKSIIGLKANEKNLDFNIIFDEKDDDTYLGDPFRLNQILTNLCNNAVKFTQKGKVELLITKQPNNKILFSVKDTGIGLTNDQQNKLFQSFSQADESTTRKFGGTGLGLAIAKQLVELMNGKIWVKSQQGKGSDFSFEVELTKGDPSEINSENKKTLKDLKDEFIKLKGSNILLVEDNKLNKELMHDILSTSNINILDASNGKEAVEVFKENKENLDLILMDIQMPIMDGYQASELIREIDTDIPIIALTANAMKQDITKTLNYGMNEHLNKPVQIVKLYDILLKYINKTNIVLQPKNEITTNNFKIFENINSKKGLALCDDNQSIYDRLLKRFYEEYRAYEIDTLNSFEENILKRQIHTLKGLSANIGADKLSQLAKQFEVQQDNKLLKSIIEELKNIINELKEYINKEQIQEVSSKETISKEHLEELFNNLKIAVQSKRPKNCNKAIEELEKYKLNNDDKKIFEQTITFIRKYKYIEANDILKQKI